MIDRKVAKIEMYYSKEWKSWGVITYNKDHDQLCPATWVYTKQEVIRDKKELEAKYGLKKGRNR
jgi:hypothetical protein